MSKKIGIVGAGPAGVLTAVFLAQMINDVDVEIFDVKKPLTTLIPTGGGRCNLTYFEPDDKEFAKFYPRGEKFLLSVFSKFNSLNTIEFFSSIGVDTFVQDDSRVFPVSESSKEVSNVLNFLLNKYKIKVLKNKVERVTRENGLFLIETDLKKHHFYTDLIIATGGKSNGYNLAQELGHTINKLQPALVPLKINETDFYDLAGLSLSGIDIEAFYNSKKIACVYGDLLFAHDSISGPAIFKLSSICAYIEFSKKSPLQLKINVCGMDENSLLFFINSTIADSPKKSIKNVFSSIVPKRLLELILKLNNIDAEKEITHINKKEKMIIIKNLISLELNVFSRLSGKEIVTAGGVDLKEIESKTMESKIVKNLYFVGEILDIDGFTGGFNLQNCWSTAFVCAEGIANKKTV